MAMKTLLVSLNSKYVHSSLAPWYLKAYCGNRFGDIRVLEFTINDVPGSVLSAIYAEKCDTVAFSCYIWNIRNVLDIASDLKKLSPETVIISGGPEVSFGSEEFMADHPYMDYVIRGEGEKTFSLLLEFLNGNGAVKPEYIPGLVYRHNNSVFSNKNDFFIEDLDSIPSPYTDEMISSIGNRIAYFESSRGCPFSCSYCLSSVYDGVRYFSTERVYSDLGRLVRAGVKQVKFVDRTFNCSRERARRIFEFVIRNAGGTSFHFEAAADLFDDETLRMLEKAPAGLIQLEIGVQTTNPDSLRMVNRATDLEKVFQNIEKLRKFNNIHLHLDLIAGLPAEDFKSFADSFDAVYGLRPHNLQLGFLKLLKGSRIRDEADRYGYVFSKRPPYEVLRNKFVSYEEIAALKGIEELLERYYNSGRFGATLRLVTGNFFNGPFDFFRQFLSYNLERKLLRSPVHSRELYTIMLDFLKSRPDPGSHLPAIIEALKLDFLSSHNSEGLPRGLDRNPDRDFKARCFDFLRNPKNIDRYFEEYSGIPAKEINKKVHFEVFSFDLLQRPGEIPPERKKTVVAFNYGRKDRVTGLYEHKAVPFF